MTFGGGEANVAVSLAQWGHDAAFVTRLPRNDIAEACIQELRGLGVDTRAILRGGERMGIYFLESGASQRASTVTYDRAGSSIATVDPAELDWPSDPRPGRAGSTSPGSRRPSRTAAAKATSRRPARPGSSA